LLVVEVELVRRVLERRFAKLVGTAEKRMETGVVGVGEVGVEMVQVTCLLSRWRS
jgi:hypothetical protein